MIRLITNYMLSLVFMLVTLADACGQEETWLRFQNKGQSCDSIVDTRYVFNNNSIEFDETQLLNARPESKYVYYFRSNNLLDSVRYFVRKNEPYLQVYSYDENNRLTVIKDPYRSRLCHYNRLENKYLFTPGDPSLSSRMREVYLNDDNRIVKMYDYEDNQLQTVTMNHYDDSGKIELRNNLGKRNSDTYYMYKDNILSQETRIVDKEYIELAKYIYDEDVDLDSIQTRCPNIAKICHVTGSDDFQIRKIYVLDDFVNRPLSKSKTVKEWKDQKGRLTKQVVSYQDRVEVFIRKYYDSLQ